MRAMTTAKLTGCTASILSFSPCRRRREKERKNEHHKPFAALSPAVAPPQLAGIIASPVEIDSNAVLLYYFRQAALNEKFPAKILLSGKLRMNRSSNSPSS